MKTANSYKQVKLCSQCGSWRGPLSLEYFDIDSRTKDGRRSMCKICRREKRYATLAQNNGQTPSVRQSQWHRAKSSSPNAKTKLLAIANDAWLLILFVGGFCWSTLNGSFAFLKSAQVISAEYSGLVAVLAAGVLTLGTAVSASWSARVYRNRRVTAAMVLMMIFVILQSLNLVVNLSGVKKRLLLGTQRQIHQEHAQRIGKLQAMKADYQRIIERYPPVNQEGNPVVWKPEITQTVKTAHDEIRKLNQKIMQLDEEIGDAEPQFAWHLLVAWLVLPELCMLTAIIVFSFGKIDENKGDNQEKE